MNLPARDKTAPPGYQSIQAAQIPVVSLPGGGTVRVIAGEHAGARGPARTFTPILVWELRLDGEHRTDLGVPDSWTTLLAVLRGTLRVNGSDPVGAAEVALFDRSGTRICVDGADHVTALLLAGEPIDEPIVGSGPFVMNSAAETRTAMLDYQSGRMGHLG